MTFYDAAVIGGGLAGASLAALLAKAGRSVVLFEKEKFAHDKVCGEFISHEGAHYLSQLGVCLESLGAIPIRGVRLARRGNAVTARLPFDAWSLSRRVLDEALLQRAAQAGAEVRRGVRVKALEKAGNGWRLEAEGGTLCRAVDIFLASGKHDLKDLKRPPGRQPDLIAFKMYWRLDSSQAAKLAGHVELMLFPGGYAGMEPVEGGRANLCLLVRQPVFSERYRSWEGLLSAMQASCPHLAARLQGAAPLLEKPLTIARLPYGHVARESGPLWRLGDQAAVIPSFSGDGMSIALHSAHLAAACYLRSEGACAYQRKLASQLSRQVARATLLSRLLVVQQGQRLAMGAAQLTRSAIPLGAILTRIPGVAATV